MLIHLNQGEKSGVRFWSFKNLVLYFKFPIVVPLSFASVILAY